MFNAGFGPLCERNLWQPTTCTPLAYIDLSWGWSDTVACYDACPSGMGVRHGEASIHATAQVGRIAERSRYIKVAGEEFRKPRISALAEAGSEPFLTDPLSVIEDLDATCVGNEAKYYVDPFFFEVLDHYLNCIAWNHTCARRFRRNELIHVKEAKASLWSLRKFAVHCRRTRVLQIGDNMNAILAHGKGRCSAWSLLVVCRRRAALLLARCLVVSERWIPSEKNDADLPSRVFESNAHKEVDKRDWLSTEEHKLPTSSNNVLTQERKDAHNDDFNQCEEVRVSDEGFLSAREKHKS